ncbi:hypothetical protein [Geomesophilobacter sediminis]|uniref:Dockerin domain-containing protein n=1 Tax=Geomesophilobacter sediminis TaxID=2798584 RepID=A0A8J7LWM0_9BACT|nr:hypothetical protein [Geomesophilobacter sediminis]MBJ6725980.1 hypothetical protein [Geomesophilobacter sediminis]
MDTRQIRALTRGTLLGSLALLAALLHPDTSWGWGYDANINTPVFKTMSSVTLTMPQVVSDGAGGAIVAAGANSGPSSHGIYLDRIDAGGNPVASWPAGGVVQVVQGQNNMRSISDGSGGIIMVWQDYRGSATEADLYAQHLDKDGKVVAGWSVDGVAVCTATSDQLNPQLVSDGAGGAIIVWQDLRNGTNFNIYAQHLDANGSVHAGWSANGVAVSTATNNKLNPQLIGDGTGGAIIAWEDNRTGTGSSIYASRIDGNGTIHAGWTADGVAVSQATTELTPQLAADGAGGAFIAWEDFRNDPLHADIYLQRIDGSGAIHDGWGAGGTPVCIATNSQLGVEMVADGAGGVILAWQDLRNGANYDIYAQHMDANGAMHAGWTLNGIPVSQVTSAQLNPQLVSDGAGGAIIVWEDYRSGLIVSPDENMIEVNADIYAQRIAADGHAVWDDNGIAISTPEDDQMNPQIVADGTGGAIIVWQDFRSDTHYDIYAQRVFGNGLVSTYTTLDGIVTPANGKSAPDLADAQRLLKIATGQIAPTANDLAHGDVAPLGSDGMPKGDGKIDIYDVIGILRMTLGLQ